MLSALGLAHPALASELAPFAGSPTAPGPDAALTAALRTLLVEAVPPTLFESSPGWGNKGGTGRKVRVTADKLADSLIFSINDVRVIEPDRLTFTVAAWFDVHVFFEQQRWKAGVRLYGVGARARLRVKLALRCEASLRLETANALLPDVVLQLRIAGSQVAYDHLVVEHLAGLGGTGARWLGEVVRGTVHELRPSLERKLLERANAAILKAGHSREVRLGVGNLLRSKR
jgi:hypothetical protein